jgi:acyl carrier protein
MVSEKIRDIWKRELVLPQISDDDDFFDLGGHSMIMQKVQVGINEEVGIEVPMDELFRLSTVAQISGYIENLMARQSA